MRSPIGAKRFLERLRLRQVLTPHSGSKGHFRLKENEILSGKYLIEKFLDHGSYGQVASCLNLATNEKVALKILRNDLPGVGKKEVFILKKLRKLDQDHVVKFTEHFKHEGHYCLVFEMLDMNLHHFMRLSRFKPLCLCTIREITQQMLVALNALKSIGLVHSDLKTDNIMLVNHQSQPLKVKMIDFGLAKEVSKIFPGTTIQATGYRAPEVILGLPMNEGVDMWSLGCIMAFMYLGRHLYPLDSEYEVIRVLLQMQGQPDDYLLNSGTKTENFFSKETDSPNPSWKLKTRAQYRMTTGLRAKRCKNVYDTLTSLDDIEKIRRGEKDATKHTDTQAFLSLLKQMLHVDPAKRITPSEALGHCFITKKHMPCDTNNKPKQSSVAAGTKDEPPATAHRTTAGTNDGPPAKARLNEATAAGTKKRPPSDGVSFVEVKTQKKFLKWAREFSSRKIKLICCCKVDLTVERHTAI
ncbi:homeodomain-interacting protein kinase 2-like [Sebastes fasciatus]|uniref:homeodomain-interacting protein kinase 2-like n=1 Tax=Sebastes fasciatus TaxID=394691 RepID=UPI003D9DB230